MQTPGSQEAKTNEARHSYSSVHVAGPYIAVTFDDGPSPVLTPKLLDMLKARGIKATFFLIGQNAKAHPEIVKRIVAEGHEVGNHSWSHPALNKCSPDKFRHELQDTSDAIEAASGVRPKLLRPPYGATNSNLDRRIDDEFKMKVILWSIDPMDWKYRNSERVANVILSQAKPGDITLSHDIHATTVAAMPQVFDGLLAKGFKFVTVSELIALQTPVPKASASPKTSPAATSPKAKISVPPQPSAAPPLPSVSPSPTASPLATPAAP